MGTTDEIADIPENLRKYIREIKKLLTEYKVESTKDLIKLYRNDSSFKEAWHSIWKEIAYQNGGKLSGTTILAIIGASLGGVGIAAGGGAIGLPLALVLGLTGFISGSMVDSWGLYKNTKLIKTRIPNELYSRLESKCLASNISVSDYVTKLIIDNLIDSDDLVGISKE